jgi:hypothetical protein
VIFGPQTYVFNRTIKDDAISADISLEGTQCTHFKLNAPFFELISSYTELKLTNSLQRQSRQTSGVDFPSTTALVKFNSTDIVEIGMELYGQRFKAIERINGGTCLF